MHRFMTDRHFVWYYNHVHRYTAILWMNEVSWPNIVCVDMHVAMYNYYVQWVTKTSILEITDTHPVKENKMNSGLDVDLN